MKHTWLIFLLGAAGIWKAIPVGFILDMDPFLIALTTIFGQTAAIIIIFFFGRKIKNYFAGRMTKKTRFQNRSEKFRKIFDKYGAMGVGFIGSFIFGPNMTMILGLFVVKNEARLLGWTIVGTIFWTAVLTIIATYSIELFNRLQII
jgi:hypothetical protein